MDKDANCRGFTLLEVVIASLLLTMMLLGLYGILDSSLAISRRVESQVNVQQDLRLAMDRMMREVRQAKGEVTVGDGSFIQFMDWRQRRVKYYVKGSKNELYRSDGSTDKPLTGGIGRARFTYDPELRRVELSLEGVNNLYNLQSRVTLRTPEER
ncbi:MAG: PilW family protein [Bacillota bacterium]